MNRYLVLIIAMGRGSARDQAQKPEIPKESPKGEFPAALMVEERCPPGELAPLRLVREG